ncbi:unnamed protein product [Scytosiphon promiscuus]
MGGSLGGPLDRGEAGNIATMKRVLDKYEKIKGERAGPTNSDDTDSNGSGSSVIPGVSDETLYNELERDMAAVAEPLHGGGRDPQAASTAFVGTPPLRYDSGGNGDGNGKDSITRNSSSSSSSGGGGGDERVHSSESPSTIRYQERVERRENQPETLAPSPRAPCILVVDDSRVSCQIAKRSLSKANFQVKLASDGELGLAMLHADASSFDLVLLDVVMPGLDGVEMLTRMKQDPRLCHLPVAILSGLEDERLEKLCLQQGATAVLRKPMMADDVVRVVKTCCTPKMMAVPASNSQCVPAGLAAKSNESSPSPPSPPPRSSLSPSVERASATIGACGVDGVDCGGIVCGGDLFGSGDRASVGGNVDAEDLRACSAVIAGGGMGDEGGSGDGGEDCESSPLSCARSQVVQLEGKTRKDDTATAAAGEQEAASHPTKGGHAARAVAAAAAVVATVATVAAASASVSPICTSAGSGGGSGGLEDESPGSPARGELPSPRGDKAISTTKVTVLIVDDSVISSKLAIRKLRTLGYAAISAANGRAALDILRRFPDRVSFVLVDIVMPVMNGVELLHVIKNDPSLCQIPVVVVSSLERQQLETLCLESGALAVLRKPLNTGEIQSFAAQVGLALPAPPPGATQPVHPSLGGSPVITAAAAATRATAV